MTQFDASQQEQLGKSLWQIANDLRGAMNADDFRDYMLSLIFLYFLSGNYEQTAAKVLGDEYPKPQEDASDAQQSNGLTRFFEANPDDRPMLEQELRRRLHYVIAPEHLWSHISEMARVKNDQLLRQLESAFKTIENDSFAHEFEGLFSEINLNSEKLGRNYTERNATLCQVITTINGGLPKEFLGQDLLGDAYEYLIGQFAANSGKKAGEFYTPQTLSTILSHLVTLDSQAPSLGYREEINQVLDFTCGSGSLLLNVNQVLQQNGGRIGKILGQERNITTYNLARMNMLLHGVKTTEFEIFHGDTLTNDWDAFEQQNPSEKIECDAIVANPPFSLRWDPTAVSSNDFRYQNYGVAPKSAADFAFLLHGFQYLSDTGTMAIILPHGVLFRGGAEASIRTKLLQDNHIDAVIGMPQNLFFSTGIPVCILVLKKCKKDHDVLFINAAEHFEKGKRQNSLRAQDIDKVIQTYRQRSESERYARRVPMAEIEANEFNLNISRYVSTAEAAPAVDLAAVHQSLHSNHQDLHQATTAHNAFLAELGLPSLP